MKSLIKYLLKAKFLIWLPGLLICMAHVNAGDTFSPTNITSTASSSRFAKTDNAFKNSASQTLTGQCTWYVYGRVMELVDKGDLDSSVYNKFRNAFWKRSGRDAKNWKNTNFLGGTWHCTNDQTLPMQYRRKGLVAVWTNSSNGHVGFVEEISADKKRYRLSDFNRAGNTRYRNKWYPFLGTEDALGRQYPCFQTLTLPDQAPSLGDMYNDFRTISIAHIHSFLQQFPNGDLKNPSLHTRFSLDANNFYQIETNWNLSEIRNGVSKMSPAEIIYYAAKENNINPVLLLAKIQQEQSLIERPATQHKLDRATGYDIPNSNPAGNPIYKSFLAQLTGLTYQFDQFRKKEFTFQEAYNKYTVDYTGQEASFSRFMTIYEKYAVLMDDVIQTVPSMRLPKLQSPANDSQEHSTTSVAFTWDNNNTASSITSVEFTLRKVSSNDSETATKGDYVGSCGRMVEGKGRGKPIGNRENYSSALCGGRLEPNQWYKWAVTLYFNNGAEAKGFSAYFKTEHISIPSSDYVWQGNGSLISYHGRLLPHAAGQDWPYGITQDVVKLHPSSNKPVGFFQWQVNETNCQNLRLEAKGLSSPVDVTLGSWKTRDDDITFANVFLPFVLGRSNTDNRFEMNDGKWYLVKVAVHQPLNQEIKLNAECTTATPTDISYRRGGGEARIMKDGYQWQGNASIISHMFRHQWHKSENSSDIDWPYGVFRDLSKVHPSSEKPMVFFQWQRDTVCSRLTFDAELGHSEKQVDIHVKNWSAPNNDATVHRRVTLPYTISDNSTEGNWRVIQIKFLKPVSSHARVTAKCAGID
ncbi:MAG TPA: CHAP domain-containing protein [Thiotrichaceae bacterium]|nr:CHAP domain-containing protein [Thiotrichaceae bacterium]